MTQENQMATTSVVTLFDTDKAQRQYFIADFLGNLYDGRIDPIKAHYSLKCMEEILKGITADATYKDMVVSEAERYGRKFEYHNSEISIRETGVKYDYANTNDADLLELMSQQRDLEQQIKERQQFLRSIPEGGIDIVDEDGEVRRVYPPAKSSTTSVVVTLK